MKLEIPPIALAAFAAGTGLLLWGWAKKKPGESWATGAGVAAVDAVADAGTGVVLGLGDVFGLPRTDESECDKALREGRTWDASFACPASRFIQEGVFGSGPKPSENTGGASGSW